MQFSIYHPCFHFFLNFSPREALTYMSINMVLMEFVDMCQLYGAYFFVTVLVQCLFPMYDE